MLRVFSAPSVFEEQILFILHIIYKDKAGKPLTIPLYTYYRIILRQM